MKLTIWIVSRDRFPLAGPGEQLGVIEAPNRAEATRAAVARYGSRIVVERPTKADTSPTRAAGAAGETR